MKFFIVAPTLTVHIEDDYYTTGNVKSACCGVRTFPHINTHAFSQLTFKTGETLPGCDRCEKIYMARQANLIKNQKVA